MFNRKRYKISPDKVIFGRHSSTKLKKVKKYEWISTIFQEIGKVNMSSNSKKCILAIVTEDSTASIYEKNWFYSFKTKF